MPLKCPSCDSSEVEKIAIESEEGKQIQYNLQKYQKVKLPELYYTPSYRSELKNVFILHCKECNLIEIVDLKRKESILRTKLRKHRESRTGLALGFIIAGAFLFAGIFLVFWTEIYVEGVDIKLLDMFSHAGFTPELVTILIIVASGVFLFFFGTSILLIKIMRKWISLLEFTFKLHRMSAGDNQMYFFEYSSEREQTGFKATILRSFYGAILVLGIGILIIENFFTIPDLQQYMWTAAAITAFSILCAIPIIFIFLYVSPLITKEINLYFNNKKNLVTKNVGEWLDSALQFFAVVDIILTAIIIADSNLGGYIIIILCLVMIIFAWILVFTAIFNNYYHSELKNNLKEYLRQKYLLPIRQIRLAPQFYYCQNCGTLLDFIHEDRCSKCGGAIIKCVICGDVLQTASGKYDKVDGKSVDPQDRLAQLAKKMERKLNKDDSDVIGELACPECGVFAHVDEFYSWVQLHGTCPSCKKKISFGTNAGPEA